jgi:muramoyltetrapeptide carboxypeptidase
VSEGLRHLAPGDTVAVLAPAGPSAAEALPLVQALLARHGLVPHLYPSCHARSGYLAGPDALRLADLHAALADDSIAAIHCLRGGYGAMRLLRDIDAALVRRARKLLVGYSDITALHALWAREGLPSLHAPMPASDLVKPGREADEAALFALLMQPLPAGTVLAPALSTEGVVHRGGIAEGRLIGGNLSLVAALCGTPWAWSPEGAILFLEDVSEDLYRTDRYLAQLCLAGVLDAAAGFLIGSFTEQQSPLPLLRETLLPLNKPVLGGWPAGHGTPNRPLPLNINVRLDADAGTLTLLEPFLA